MISIKARLEEAHANFSEQFGTAFEIKLISATNGDFGDLQGMQFDSERCGGYLYFWSSGAIEFHLVDYELGDEIFPITLRTELDDAGFATATSELFQAVGNMVREV